MLYFGMFHCKIFKFMIYNRFRHSWTKGESVIVLGFVLAIPAIHSLDLVPEPRHKRIALLSG
jgi:hypothetical protein